MGFHTVENPNMQKGVQSITLNGEPIQSSIPLQMAGSVNEIVVMMG
jgi:N,N'-diacetylchitobiose phosphorylase